MSRIRLVTVLNVDMRNNARIYFLHWQHFPQPLPSADLAVVPDGVNADELHTVTWERGRGSRVRKHQLHLLLG